MSDKVKDLLSNTLFFTIANLGSKLITFFLVPLYTRVLSVEDYGIVDLVQTTGFILYPLLTLMIADAVLRFCFIDDYKIEDIISGSIRLIFLGFLVSIFITFIILKLKILGDLGYYYWLIPIIFLSHSLVCLGNSLARGVNKVRDSAFGGLISTIVIVFFNILFLVIFKIGVVGYLLSYILADICSIIYLFYRCKIVKYLNKSYNKFVIKDMCHYSIPLIPNNLSWWLLNNINRYIILGSLGIAAVGVYSATLRIPAILTVLCGIFSQAWMLTAIKDYGSDESKRFISSMYKSFHSLFIVVTAFIIVLSYPLASILLANNFLSYWFLIPYLFISVFWGAISGFLGTIFSAERKNNMQFISTFVGSIVSIVFMIIFIDIYGIIVVVYSCLIGNFIIWCIRYYSTKKIISFQLSFTYSILQNLMLIIEAYYVGKHMYLNATVLLLALFIINSKDVCRILLKLYSLIRNR